MDFLKDIIRGICQEETMIMLFPSTGGITENQLVAFPEMKERLEQAVESKCCQALRKIYDIIVEISLSTSRHDI